MFINQDNTKSEVQYKIGLHNLYIRTKLFDLLKVHPSFKITFDVCLILLSWMDGL